MADSSSALDAALRLLALRPRTQRELRQRLGRRGFDVEAIGGALRRLTELGIVDDTAFARFWVDQRAAFRPMGHRRLRSELQSKGVAPDVIASVVPTEDDVVSLEQVALKRANALAHLDEATFSRRLQGFLARRGYSFAEVRDVVQRLKRDRAGRDLETNTRTQ